MIATFKQTFESLKNLDYGTQIKKMTLGQTLSYWSKYIILLGICGLVVGIGAVVYFAPQIPKFVSDKTTEQPFIWKENGMEVYIDQEKFVATSPDGKVNEIKMSLILDNQGKILALGIIVVVIGVFSLGTVGVLAQLFQMALWTVGFWILGLILKKNLKYLEVLRFVIVASVPALILDIFGLRLLSMGVMAFYTGIWIYRLPRKNK